MPNRRDFLKAVSTLGIAPTPPQRFCRPFSKKGPIRHDRRVPRSDSGPFDMIAASGTSSFNPVTLGMTTSSFSAARCSENRCFGKQVFFERRMHHA
jgi:hypothetical protein